MSKLNQFVKATILPFVKSKVIPNDNRVQLKPGQSHVVIWKAAQRRLDNVSKNVKGTPDAISDTKLKASIPYGFLHKNNQGQWRILATDNEAKGNHQPKSREIVPEGQYAFVRTEQGFLRVSPVAGDANHRALSDHAARVRYAGMLHFKKNDKGEAVLDYWENASGGYQPPASLSVSAGLPLQNFRALSEDKLVVNPVAIKKQEVKLAGPQALAVASIAIDKTASADQPRLSACHSIFFNFKPIIHDVIAAKQQAPVVTVPQLNCF